jgi:hypothetical protein
MATIDFVFKKLMADLTADVSLALVLVTFLLVCVTFYQVRLFRRELILTKRPRLRVRNVVLRQPKPIHAPIPEIFARGTLVSGQFYVDNVGGTPANISDCGCWVTWFQGLLPMERPYEGENGNIPIKLKLKPGMSMPIPFCSDKTMGEEGPLIKSGEKNWHLYVMGWIEYIDNLRIGRRTAFCREYSASEGRFIKVDNRDYEHEN